MAVHFLLLAALASCGDDQDPAQTVPHSRALVTDEADGSPVAGVKVIVMDPRHNQPVAGPFVSGSDGMVALGLLPRTDLYLMAFGGVDYMVHSLPEPGIWAGAEGIPASRSPLAVGLGNVEKYLQDPAEIRLRRVPVDSLPRIAGKVLSAHDGAPLDQVFVSLSPDLTGYQMGTRASDDVTGRDGAFSVSQIPFAKDPQTGNLIQLNPLRFTRAGWRPVVWRYDPPNGSENVDIRGVTVEMVQLDYYRGVITGLLVRDGQPAVAVPVGLGTLDQTGDKAGAGMVGWVETTDVFGRFIIGGLPPGTYILQPGYALGDGVFYPSQPAGGPVTIGDRDVIDVGTLELWHEIVPRDPPHGAELAAAPAALNWSAVPGALSYQVRFDRTVLPVTGTNAITLPDSLVIAPGLHYWSVLAGGETGGLVGSTQIQAVFRYSPPD